MHMRATAGQEFHLALKIVFQVYHKIPACQGDKTGYNMAMERLIAQAHKLLLKNKKTVAAAESCTGGMLSEFLTRNSGSSQYFLLGTVTYSNKSKNKILGIPGRIILQQGAVSKETACRMAAAVRRIAASNIGLAITGIAGPGGATPGKPVGTVFIALDASGHKACKRFSFSGSRQAVRKKAALEALRMLCAHLSP